MGSISVTTRYESSETLIPNAFIDGYMMKAIPVYVMIYIYGMRVNKGGACRISTDELAKSMNILESDVVNAWKHWEREGLVHIEENGKVTEVVFLNIPAKNQASKQESLSKLDCPPKMEKRQPLGLSVKPNYSTEELAMYQEQSAEIRGLFKHAEKVFGKLLTHTDLNLIYSLYDWLRLPTQVIEFLLSYCADSGRQEPRYIESIAVDWADKGIDSTETASEYLLAYKRKYRVILKALNLDFYPLEHQRRIMDRWIDEFQMPEEIILAAIDRAIESKNSPSFAYINGILSNWRDAGIRTMEAVEKSVEDHKISQASKKKSEGEKRGYAKKNRFVNFTQRNNDYAELERLEMEYLKQGMKG
ncbi:MAG: DnaD domain protein [Clostridiales bacterium]|nr:DnaD domain protein [Clostridiales bacterium]